MDKIWKIIRKWLTLNAPDIHEDLLPGVMENEIQLAEKEFGLKLPEDMRESLSICNGQLGGAAPLLGEWQIISLKVSVKKWKMLNSIFSEQDEKSTKQNDDSWNPGLIPVAYNGAGDFLCIDLNKKPSDDYGRIIPYWHVYDGKAEVVAKSYKSWLSEFANDLDSNCYSYSEEDGMVKLK